jgi:hypothetical protein
MEKLARLLLTGIDLFVAIVATTLRLWHTKVPQRFSLVEARTLLGHTFSNPKCEGRTKWNHW